MYEALIKPLYKDSRDFVLDVLFPVRCISCEKYGKFICEMCLADFSAPDFQKCISCRKPSPNGITHEYCLSPHNAEQLISLFDYRDERVGKAIIHGKYYWLKDTFKILGKRSAQKLKEKYPDLLQANSYILTPIPLHPSRKRWRGFNQSEILCQAMSEELNLPCSSVLVRTKSTKTQKDLKREQRIKNVSSAFVVTPNTLDSIKGKNFILVDDVTTTGATLVEAVKVLKRNGAGKVICLTVARD